MRFTLQQLLALTRQVFAGTVNRAELASRSSLEQVFVATAIMLVAREDFLDDNDTVRGIYSRVLESLLSVGTVNYFAGEKGFRHGSALITVAQRAGLYRSTPRRGGAKPIVLTPPIELQVLVRELGRTPAIDAFLRDSAAGIQRNKRWREERERFIEDMTARQIYQDHMDEVLRVTEEQFGLEGLRDLRSRIEQRLRS